ncbi:MAG TPA: class I SAM-dependent methyltransferase [Gemmatimonadaceae bacterium]|nr:class I SAM-dependent methyltransferase [Gemmatimonadaceae bacterium]
MPHGPSRAVVGDADPRSAQAQTMWTSGDYGRIAAGYERGAAEFVVRLDIHPRETVLDVACGTGNLTIPAARTGAAVTGVDIAPNLIAQARARAAAEGLSVRLDTGDAERLRYGDAAFDVAMSMFGVMFAPRPERAAAELLRVVRPGGRIALANWTPTGFVGELQAAAARYVRAAVAPAPLLWGTEQTVRDRLGAGLSTLTTSRRIVNIEYPLGPRDVVEQFIRRDGPTMCAYESIGDAARRDFRRALEAIWRDHNRASDGWTCVAAEYLEVIGIVG